MIYLYAYVNKYFCICRNSYSSQSSMMCFQAMSNIITTTTLQSPCHPRCCATLDVNLFTVCVIKSSIFPHIIKYCPFIHLKWNVSSYPYNFSYKLFMKSITPLLIIINHQADSKSAPVLRYSLHQLWCRSVLSSCTWCSFINIDGHVMYEWACL